MAITFRMVRHFFFGLTGLVGLTGIPEVSCGTLETLVRDALIPVFFFIICSSPFGWGRDSPRHHQALLVQVDHH